MSSIIRVAHLLDGPVAAVFISDFLARRDTLDAGIRLGYGRFLASHKPSATMKPFPRDAGRLALSIFDVLRKDGHDLVLMHPNSSFFDFYIEKRLSLILHEDDRLLCTVEWKRNASGRLTMTFPVIPSNPNGEP